MRVQERTIILSKIVWMGEERLGIACPYRARLRAKGLPHARWDGALGVWHVPFTGASWAALENAFPPFESDITGYHYESLDAAVGTLAESAIAWKSAQDAKGMDDLPDIPIKGSAAMHQRRCFYFASGLKSAGLFVDMGGGKSAVAIGLLEEWDAKRVLILCPKSVIGVWPKQLRLHSLREYRVWMGDGGGVVKKRAQDLFFWLMRTPSQTKSLSDGSVAKIPQPSVAVMNYDIAWRPGMCEVLLREPWDVIILDESHKIKSAGGKASRFVAKLTKEANAARVLLLTGTPTPHGPEDIYGQYRAADRNIFGTNYDRFKKEFFYTRPVNDKIDRIIGFMSDDAEAKFKQKMASISIVVKKEDMTPMGDFDPGRVWSLPDLERECRLDLKTWKAYTELRSELITEVEAGTVTADNILVKGLRLRQITGGFVKTTEGDEVTLGLEKLKLLEEVIEDVPNDACIVVFGVFHHDLDAMRSVAEIVGRPYLELSGRRRDALASDSTLASEGGELIGVQLQSGGVGVDFTRAAYGCYYSIDYNLGNVLQSRARLDRPGQVRPVTWIHLVATGPMGQRTVDGITYDALLKREQLNNAVLDALRKGL